MFNILEMKNLIKLMDSKSAWFNKRIPVGEYKTVAPAKELIPDNLKDFLHKYDNNSVYIHNISSVIGTVSGLADLFIESSERMKRINLRGLLVRGYTHDWRIIIYILITTGFTLWFNSEPLEVPQIEYTRHIIHHPYFYQISHF